MPPPPFRRRSPARGQRLDDQRPARAERLPVPQGPRFIARAAGGVRWEGLAAEFGVRHLGDRYASEAFYRPRLSGYTVIDLAGRYRWRFLEIGLALENLNNTAWRSSELFYESRPIPDGPASEDFHFTPGNPFNVPGLDRSLLLTAWGGLDSVGVQRDRDGRSLDRYSEPRPRPR